MGILIEIFWVGWKLNTCWSRGWMQLTGKKKIGKIIRD